MSVFRPFNRRRESSRGTKWMIGLKTILPAGRLATPPWPTGARATAYAGQWPSRPW